MPKCGTIESCYGCPLRPDETDRYYQDPLSEKLGVVAESLPGEISLEECSALSAAALGWNGISISLVQRVMDASKIRFTPVCAIQK